MVCMSCKLQMSYVNPVASTNGFMDYLSLLCILDIFTDLPYGFLQSSFNSLSGTITIVEERLSILEGIVRTLIRRTDSSGNLEVRKLA